MVGARRVTIPESEAFRTRHEVPRVKKRQGMELAPRDSLDVDRRIPVTEIRHQLLFKTQNNFFRENLTIDNSLREKRHQQDGSSCKKLKVENKLLYKALLYS